MIDWYKRNTDASKKTDESLTISDSSTTADIICSTGKIIKTIGNRLGTWPIMTAETLTIQETGKKSIKIGSSNVIVKSIQKCQ